ncbi:hypothetical protein CYMTET_44800 [Cymbomonas tetramitiformis]|uniref:Uncharacterized protein n=1 Tax=Cymbomonas tetramitiformis TaxID=36881 RepID=A0AAE0F0C1_9CHLO|nr:hypothetical protein CYMTET_44800 [Cymbomonas tetramitiformis]
MVKEDQRVGRVAITIAASEKSLRDHREIVISTPEKFNLSHAAQRALKASASYESMDDTVKAEVDNKTILAGVKESTLERRTCNGLEASKGEGGLWIACEGFVIQDLFYQADGECQDPSG